MARVLSENTYQRMMTSIGTTEGLAGPSRAPSVRRVRTGGTGAGSVRSYVKITAITGAYGLFFFPLSTAFRNRANMTLPVRRLPGVGNY